MLQNCHKNSSCLHESREALHFASALSKGWSLSDSGACVQAGKDRCVPRWGQEDYQEVCADLISLRVRFWMHTAHHLDRDHHRALAVWITGISAIQRQQMYTQQNWLDFARYKVDPKFSQKEKKKVLGSRWIFSLVVKFLSTWVISKGFTI